MIYVFLFWLSCGHLVMSVLFNSGFRPILLSLQRETKTYGANGHRAHGRVWTKCATSFDYHSKSCARRARSLLMQTWVAYHFELCFITFRPPLPSIFSFLVIINKNLNFALSLSRYCVLHPGAIKVFLSSCLHTISKKDWQKKPSSVVVSLQGWFANDSSVNHKRPSQHSFTNDFRYLYPEFPIMETHANLWRGSRLHDFRS